VEEQAQGVEVRRRRSRAEAEQLVAEYEASGLSQVEFCRKQGLSLTTLCHPISISTEMGSALGAIFLGIIHPPGSDLERKYADGQQQCQENAGSKIVDLCLRTVLSANRTTKEPVRNVTRTLLYVLGKQMAWSFVLDFAARFP
jgi:hypothetical protein